jgi:uncharacterized coiled-coil DUF342 family protein
MADQTPEQILKHRDFLKAENDRLNPEADALKKQVAELTEACHAAQTRADQCEQEIAKLRIELNAARRRKAEYAKLQQSLAGAKKGKE